MPLSTGEKLKPVNFTDQSGKQWSLPDEAKGEKAAIFFLRHLGCSLCKEKIAELKDSYSRFEEKSVRLIAVVQSTQKRIEQFSAKESIPFSLVADREKRLYDAFEVARGGFKEFTAPAVLKASIRATLKGHMHGKFEGDELQVPAAFLVSAAGEIIHAHYGKDISDFGDVAEILARA